MMAENNTAIQADVHGVRANAPRRSGDVGWDEPTGYCTDHGSYDPSGDCPGCVREAGLDDCLGIPGGRPSHCECGAPWDPESGGYACGV
jgi:hypothetical protein